MRRHLITRKSDNHFWCGMFGWQSTSHDAQQFESMQDAYRAVRENGFREEVRVEPAEWYPAPMVPL